MPIVASGSSMVAKLEAAHKESMYIVTIISTILAAHSLGKEDQRTWTMYGGLTDSIRVSNLEVKAYGNLI